MKVFIQILIGIAHAIADHADKYGSDHNKNYEE